jgi:hypothetical protein
MRSSPGLVASVFVALEQWISHESTGRDASLELAELRRLATEMLKGRRTRLTDTELRRWNALRELLVGSPYGVAYSIDQESAKQTLRDATVEQYREIMALLHGDLGL